MRRGKPQVIQPQQRVKEQPRVTTSPVNAEIKILSKPPSPNPKSTSVVPTPSLLQRPKEPLKIQQPIPVKPTILLPKSTIPTKKPLKLISESYEMQYKQLSEILPEKHELFIFGVIGKSNVGKSHILNQLIGDTVFSLSTETNGVDLFVQNKTVYLEAQAMFSMDLMSDIINGDGKLSNESIHFDALLELITTKTTSFFYNICNVLIVVMDDLNDLETISHVSTIKALQQGIDEKVCPELIFIFNKVEKVSLSVEMQWRSCIHEMIGSDRFKLLFVGMNDVDWISEVKTVKVNKSIDGNASEVFARCWDMLSRRRNQQ
jgi:hypothetical protein